MVVTSWGGIPTVMGELDSSERLQRLWQYIEEAHYSYLQRDDSLEKLQQRKKLEGYIMEFLSLVPHEHKFGLVETGNVFQRTISEHGEFSGYRAGYGWTALGRYAANLLAQPWRKEYRTIRLYSGYYKHDIEANLVGAETLLHKLGYKPDGLQTLSLDGPVCPDTVTAVSRDALIAHVECQIMSQIFETVCRTGARVTWADVAKERARRIGDVTLASARLAAILTTDRTHNYTDAQEIYSNIPTTVSTEQYQHTRLPELTRHPPCNHICPEDSPIEDPIMPMYHPAAYMSQPPHIVPQNIIYPQHLPEVPITMAQCGPVPVLTPYGHLPYYYTPVQTPYMVPTPMYAPIKHANTVPINGYPPLSQYRYPTVPTVPTGQLIEVDGPSVYENGVKYRDDVGRSYRDTDDQSQARKSRSQISTARNSTTKSAFSDVSLPSIPRSDTQPMLSKAKEDGMGTYESWDYVFRNLSSKDHDDRTPSLDRDSRTLDRLDRDERRARYQPTTLDLEDGLQAMTLDRTYDDDMYRTAKVNENLMKIKRDLKKSRQSAKKQPSEEKLKKRSDPVDTIISSDGLINNKTAPDKVRLLTKREVKDRKDIIKQQNSMNGAPKPINVEVKKVRKPSTTSIEAERPQRPVKVVENGHSNVAHGSKSKPGSSSSSHYSSHHQTNYDAKTHLIVSLDETDYVRRSPPKQNGETERPSSRNSTRYNGTHESAPTREHNTANVGKWQCSTCTYINSTAVSACEMCCKSKTVGPEVQPLMSGGRECPTCTLVNKKDANACEACCTSLKHCPTYI